MPLGTEKTALLGAGAETYEAEILVVAGGGGGGTASAGGGGAGGGR